MLKVIVINFIFFCVVSATCTNDCLSIEGAKLEIAEFCGKSNICFAPYTVFNEKVFFGLTPHMGTFISYYGNVTSYGLTKKGWFNSPDIILEGKVTKKKQIPMGYDIDIIGIRKISSGDAKNFNITKKHSYSAIEWDGHNCASIIVEIANKIGHKMNCRIQFGKYVFGPNIPALCSFI